MSDGAALRVNERGIVIVDERVPFALPPPDPGDPALRQGVWYHSFPYWAFGDSNVSMPYTHVYPGGTTMPNSHGASDPLPAATTDGAGAMPTPPPSPTGYGTGATGLDWRATCSASYFGDIGYSFPSASGSVAFDVGSHQQRFFAGLSMGAGEWLLPEAVTSGRSNLLEAATAQVYFVLNNVAHAYRQVGMDTPATLVRGTTTDPRPFFYCINDVPFGMAYDFTSDTAFSANDADRVTSCRTDADCKVCVDYAVGGGLMAWRCAADTRQSCTDALDTCERYLTDADPYNDQIPFCDLGHPGDEPGTGVCSMGWHSGGLTYKDGIHWLIGAFYNYLGSPRGSYGRMDAQSNVSHEAQHALACTAFADDLLTPGVDESKPCVNALESWAAGARNGFAVHAVLNEARGELPDRVLNRQRVPWFYHGAAQRRGRNSVYGGSCEAEEGTYDAAATTRCGWDDPADDFKCEGVCDDPTAGLPRVHYCTATFSPAPGPCAEMPDKYNDGMNILLDVFSEYSDSVGGFYGLKEGLRAWRLNQAQGRTTWVTGTDSFRGMIEDADWAGDRWSLVSRAFHPHVRGMRVPFSDDVPGQREFADPMGYPTRLPVVRLAQLGHPLDTDAYSFFAEAGVPLRFEAEVLDLIDLSVCVEGSCSPGPGAPHPSVGDTVTVLFTPSATGFHFAQVLLRGAFVGPGRYRLTIERLVPDAPDSAAAAESIPTGGVDVATDSVWIRFPPEPDEDEDWYRFWFAGASTTGVVRVFLRVAGEHADPGAIRAQMMRFDGSHSRELLVGDNELVLDSSDRGAWYIKVVSASIAGPVEYSLRVSIPLPGDREVCPGLATGSPPEAGCWLGEQETSVVTADLWGSHASTPSRGLERTEDIDQYLVCLEQDESVSIFLRDGVQRLRMELRNPFVRDPAGDEALILGPGGGHLAWGYNVDNDRGVSASDVLLMSAEHGNAPGAGGAVLHFVSPNGQCYVLSVRASFGDDRVEEWDSVRRTGLDDELFWASARYDLFVVKGCVPGEIGCTSIQPVPTLY